ncbi:MAG: hypothetical protein NTW93_01800 [Phycisphaerae bacterium]|nr:hypothetical protein [Phycisphaerae bacterium]
MWLALPVLSLVEGPIPLVSPKPLATADAGVRHCEAAGRGNLI